MTTYNDSPVVQFMRLAWAHCGGKPHSWREYNWQILDALEIAVAGMPWREGDADVVFNLGVRGYSSGIRRCLVGDGFDGLYTIAVHLNNMSAIKELERYMGRQPIIVDDVTGCRPIFIESAGDSVSGQHFHGRAVASRFRVSTPRGRRCVTIRRPRTHFIALDRRK